MRSVQMYGQGQSGQEPIAPKTTMEAVDGLVEAMGGKAGAEHTHAMSDVTGLPEALSGKAAASHTHAQSDVTGLADALAAAVTQAVSAAKLAAHPVGSYYWSDTADEPGTLFGGTWERVKDKFILAAGDSYAAGAMGGAASVALTEAQLPVISGSVLAGYGNNGSTAGGFGPFRSASGCLSVAQERQYTGPTTSTATALSGNFAQAKLDIGGGESIGIMPPYLTAYCWRRTA